MDTHRKDESIIFPIRKIELLPPQPDNSQQPIHSTTDHTRPDSPLNNMRIHIPLRPTLIRNRLQRRPIIQMPVRRNLDDLARPHLTHGVHPRRSGLLEVRFDPGLAGVGSEVGLQVVVHKGVVVEDVVFLEEGDEFFGGGPEGRGVSDGRFAAEFGQTVDGADDDVLLLLGGKLGERLVGVTWGSTSPSSSREGERGRTMKTDLMPTVADFGQLLWERLNTVSWDEPGGFDVVSIKQLQQTIDANGGTVDAP